MQQPVKDLLIAGGRWTKALDRHHAMEGTFWTWGLKSAFHFLELSFPKVDLFYFYFYFWFVSFPFQSQCRVTASFHGFGVAGGGMRNRPGMCLLLGTAESRVVCPLLFFFSHEVKNWCCQKMIVTICLTGDVFLNFTNRLCFEGPLPRQHMVVAITDLVFVTFCSFSLPLFGVRFLSARKGF